MAVQKGKSKGTANNDDRKVGGGKNGGGKKHRSSADTKNKNINNNTKDDDNYLFLYESSGRMFTTMYIVSYYLDVSEDWKQDKIWFKQTVLSFYVLYIFSGCSLKAYGCVLVAVNTMMMKYSFPDLANHLNFALILNTFQVTTMLYLWVCNTITNRRPRNRSSANSNNQTSSTPTSTLSSTFPSYGQYFQLIRPWIGIFVSMAYFFAGFHKLNWDYLNTDVSCTRNFLNRILKHWGLLDRNIQFTSDFVYWSSILTLVWEIIGAFMIWIPQTQPYMMAYSLLMHMVFATIGFYDFTSMMCALWFVLLPNGYLRIINSDDVCSERIRRWVYTMFPFFVLTCTILYNPETKNRAIVFRLGLCFIAAISFLMWPILAKLLFNYETIPKWEQSYGWSFRPMFLWLFPLFLTFYGMNNYLGLRTAGNFSMFSNLRTEGPKSNHLLLGNNPWKLFHYPDEVIKTANGAMVLPLVEFQRRILKEKREREQQIAGGNNRIQPLAVDVIVKGELIESDDVVTDPRWEFQPSWEHYWLHFRTVQGDDKPNKCRW